MLTYVIAYNHGSGLDIIEDVALDEKTAYRLAFETADIFVGSPPLFEWAVEIIDDFPPTMRVRKVTTWTREHDTVRILAIETTEATTQ